MKTESTDMITIMVVVALALVMLSLVVLSLVVLALMRENTVLRQEKLVTERKRSFAGTCFQRVMNSHLRYTLYRLKLLQRLLFVPFPLQRYKPNHTGINKFRAFFANKKIPTFFPRLHRYPCNPEDITENITLLKKKIQDVCGGLEEHVYHWDMLMMFGPYEYLTRCSPIIPMDHPFVEGYLIQLDFLRWMFMRKGPDIGHFCKFSQKEKEHLRALRGFVFVKWGICQEQVSELLGKK